MRPCLCVCACVHTIIGLASYCRSGAPCTDLDSLGPWVFLGYRDVAVISDSLMGESFKIVSCLPDVNTGEEWSASIRDGSGGHSFVFRLSFVFLPVVFLSSFVS